VRRFRASAHPMPLRCDEEPDDPRTACHRGPRSSLIKNCPVVVFSICAPQNWTSTAVSLIPPPSREDIR